jgi:hypothetical protein
VGWICVGKTASLANKLTTKMAAWKADSEAEVWSILRPFLSLRTAGRKACFVSLNQLGFSSPSKVWPVRMPDNLSGHGVTQVDAVFIYSVTFV